MPLESERISAMPMMPMEPANAVKSVRPFFVMRFVSDRLSAVLKLMEGLPDFDGARGASALTVKGAESPVTLPSRSRIVRVA